VRQIVDHLGDSDYTSQLAAAVFREVPLVRRLPGAQQGTYDHRSDSPAVVHAAGDKHAGKPGCRHQVRG
jgi:hypothetical protein